MFLKKKKIPFAAFPTGLTPSQPILNLASSLEQRVGSHHQNKHLAQPFFSCW
jgi:hypothetical protein